MGQPKIIDIIVLVFLVVCQLKIKIGKPGYTDIFM